MEPATYDEAISEINRLNKVIREQEARHLANEVSFAKLEIELAHAKMDRWGMKLGEGHRQLDIANNKQSRFYENSSEVS